MNSNEITVINSQVVKQQEVYDCGLFALGYAMAIANDINPSTVRFEQHLMRFEYNNMIKNNNVYLFPHSFIDDPVSYKFFDINLADVKLSF